MLAIAGGKGGVGKTTTTLGLAAALPDRPLVVDADRDMPDLHALARVPRSNEDPTDDPPLAADHGCRVLPVPNGELPPAAERLAAVRADWEADGAPARSTVLVDTPAGAGIDAATPLRAADGAVLVSTACAPALRNAAKTAAMARAVDTPVVGAVLTRTAVRPPNAAELLGCPVLAAVPRVDGRPLDARRVRERYERAATALRDRADVVPG
ncbi:MULTISPECIES: MinD/ParA family ATP-binding protein [Halolamina]|uniref:Septum site-determining protein MinD n=1 Tax=Halolamina pelagica TaxID=699431 RepID=A0A1I5MKZ8_9EURY|nr:MULTISPECIES: hypothetical protein [Halolamina]NHX36052.1 CDP-4-keto-6-deoxy-D-glucose-3-dehydrase [Halolamina sp. R1-12]SFP09626.1 septum site-determining protein MinD [Halolamina pelagica]